METSLSRRTLWMLTPLWTGAIVMTLELAASRLYAPYFGFSIYVWGTLLAVVMLALAVGYAVGGYWADRCQSDRLLYTLILVSAVYQLMLIPFAGPVLSCLTAYGDFVGTSVATILLFAPPLLTLAAVGPFVIRLLTRAERVGAWAGTVYAVSTLGSILGACLTSYVLIPQFGTHFTLRSASVVSASLALLGLVPQARWLWVAALPAIVLMTPSASPWTKDAVWASESAYNLVRVFRSGQQTLLALNEDTGVHTIRNETTLWTGHYYDLYALGPVFTPVQRALVLGMGAGGSIHALRAVAAEVTIDAVEIDAQVVEAGTRFFGLPQDADWLHIHVADARPWLARTQQQYDLVQVDLYQGGPYIPFYLATSEFFSSVHAHLTDKGLLMMNVFDMSPERELLSAISATVKQVFPSVLVVPHGTANYMLLAFAQTQSLPNLRHQLTEGVVPTSVFTLARRAASTLTEVHPPQGTPVFTDDHAPIEALTRRMLREHKRVVTAQVRM
ncbi:MAG: hypothetical protein FJ147_05360 [Deltaproteobacteria bacterium]|nr:hypothetical protein [Deltaproteobacteria bacterium]